MCSSGCPTQNHETYGACLRSKHLQIDRYGLAHSGEQTAVDRELAAYRSARQQGIQPAGTKLAQTRDAVDKSETLGRAFRADNGDM